MFHSNQWTILAWTILLLLAIERATSTETATKQTDGNHNNRIPRTTSAPSINTMDSNRSELGNLQDGGAVTFSAGFQTVVYECYTNQQIDYPLNLLAPNLRCCSTFFRYKCMLQMCNSTPPSSQRDYRKECEDYTDQVKGILSSQCFLYENNFALKCPPPNRPATPQGGASRVLLILVIVMAILLTLVTLVTINASCRVMSATALNKQLLAKRNGSSATMILGADSGGATLIRRPGAGGSGEGLFSFMNNNKHSFNSRVVKTQYGFNSTTSRAKDSVNYEALKKLVL